MKSDLVDIADVKHAETAAAEELNVPAVKLHHGSDFAIIPPGMERAVCKIGQGAECCIFLVGGSKGLECAKFSELAQSLLARKAAGSMSAGRVGNCRLIPEGLNS